MAIIVGADGSSILEVGATSKAARTMLYDANGVPLSYLLTGSYMLPVNIRHTSAAAANSVVWAMRNGAARTVLIRRFHFQMAFDGTATAATTPRYGMQRFGAANPTGGTVLTAIKKRTTYPATTVADARQDSTGVGLGVAGISFETDAAVFGIPVSVTGTAEIHEWSFSPETPQDGVFMELGVNEGICLRLVTAAVIGLSLTGFVEYDEK